MDWFDPHLLVLAVIQGLTEFLPVSSSAHLVLAPRLLGWADQGLACDVALHFGTLLAVLFYFRHDLKAYLAAVPTLLSPRSRYAKTIWTMGIAILPVSIVGLLFNDWINDHLRSVKVIATSTIFFALLLGLADRQPAHIHDEKNVGVMEGLMIGIAQILALIPGTSRSGITLTAGRFLGLSREAAARFSFLLSIPVISLATMYEAYKLLKMGTTLPLALLPAVALSALVGFLCIRFLIHILTRFGVWPFVVYRLILGTVLLFL